MQYPINYKDSFCFFFDFFSQQLQFFRCKQIKRYAMQFCFFLHLKFYIFHVSSII